jgi:hypothetical protein
VLSTQSSNRLDDWITEPFDSQRFGLSSGTSSARLRGLLLNAYGCWTIGTYALYAAIGLGFAAGAVLLAFALEVYLAIRGRGKAAVPVLATKPQRVTA